MQFNSASSNTSNTHSRSRAVTTGSSRSTARSTQQPRNIFATPASQLYPPPLFAGTSPILPIRDTPSNKTSGRDSGTATISRNTASVAQHPRNPPATPDARPYPPPICPVSDMPPALVFFDTPTKKPSSQVSRTASSLRRGTGYTHPQVVNYDEQMDPQAVIFAGTSTRTVTTSTKGSRASPYPSPSTPGPSRSRVQLSPIQRLSRLADEEAKAKRIKSRKRVVDNDAKLQALPEDHPDSAIPLLRKSYPHFQESDIIQLDLMINDNENYPDEHFERRFKNRVDITEKKRRKSKKKFEGTQDRF